MDRTAPPSPTIIQPGEARSFWQPLPANGFVECLLSGSAVGAATPFELGTQTVAAGGEVREHLHPDNDEVIVALVGEGRALVEGVIHPMTKGTALFLPRGTAHGFFAAPDQDLVFMWLIMPGGLESFFESIGRPRARGESPPAPFHRSVSGTDGSVVSRRRDSRGRSDS